MISAKSEENKKGGGTKFSIPLPFFSKVSLSERMLFTRNLQVMISAGVSLPNSLRVLEKQAKSRRFKKILSEISKGVVKGENFSSILQRYPNVFSNLYSSMVKVGEESGTLENTLKILTNQMEKEHDLKSKIIGALVYPAVILVAMSGIGLLMLVFVIPKLSQTFADLKVELPPTTKFVIGLGNFVSNSWYLIPFIFFAVFIIFKMAAKTKIGRWIIDSILLRVPVISDLIKKTNSAYTVRTLGSLIASGVPIIKSLELVADSLSNIFFKNAILDVVEKVKKGSKMGEAMKKYEGKIYSTLVIQMIEIGEETGKTAEILSKLADFFESEVSNATKNLSSIVEPVLMIVIGAVVGFFVVSMMQPMYSMIQTMQ